MKYVWALVESAATVWVAYFVLSKVSARFEVVVVALLMMTYVTVRAGLVFLSKALLRAFTALSGFQVLILKRVGASRK